MKRYTVIRIPSDPFEFWASVAIEQEDNPWAAKLAVGMAYLQNNTADVRSTDYLGAMTTLVKTSGYSYLVVESPL